MLSGILYRMQIHASWPVLLVVAASAAGAPLRSTEAPGQALTLFPGHGFGFVNDAQARQTGVARMSDRPDREYHPPPQPVEGDPMSGVVQNLPPVALPEVYPAWAEAARRPFPYAFAAGFRDSIRRQTPLYVKLGRRQEPHR